jgi:hypothetical protein
MLGDVDVLLLLSGRLAVGERDSLLSGRALLPDSTGRGGIVVFGLKFEGTQRTTLDGGPSR